MLDDLLEIGLSYDQDYTTLCQYAHGRVTVKYRIGRSSKPEASDVLLLFKANLAHACASLLVKHPQTTPGALDFLCVSGLVGFSPAEGGPISYSQLVGVKELLAQLHRLTNHPSLGASASMFVDDAASTLLLSLAEVTLPVLTSEQLKAVGPANGIQNLAVFLNPLPISLPSVCLLGMMPASFLLAGVSWWFTGGTSFAIGVLVSFAVGVYLVKRLT